MRTGRARQRWGAGSRGGFTLLELAVVVAIVLVVAAIGWGTMADDVPRYRLVQAARGLEEDIRELRMLAIASNRETRLLLVEADPDPDDPSSWGGAWRLQAGNAASGSTSWEDLPVDALEDGVDDDHGQAEANLGRGGNREAPGVGLAPWGTIVGPATGNRDAIVFTPRGWVANPSSDFVGGYISLRLVNKRALARGIDDSIYVRVARSGYSRLESTLEPGEDAEEGGSGSS